MKRGLDSINYVEVIASGELNKFFIIIGGFE